MTTAPTATAPIPTTEPAADRAPEAPAPRRLGGARLRILGWFVLVVAGALVGGNLLLRSVLLADVEDRFDESIQQELAELAQLAGGVDPATGDPFADVRRLFDVAIERNVPLSGEAVATFVGGRTYRASATGSRLFDDDEFVAAVRDTTTSRRGTVGTDDGEVRYIAQPVLFGTSAQPDGVFVAAVYTRPEREAVDDAVQASIGVGIAALLAASAAAWIVAGRVLAPVRQVTDAARTITESDLRRRIPVEGDDEVAELAVTFNAMLDRLDQAFTAQRAFVDDAGHELRTPLTIVQGHLDLLPEDPAERRETLALVQEELDRMARIVDDLLLLARAERPDFLRRGPIDLADVVADARERAIALDDRPWRTAPPPGPVIVFADRERLLQVVLNLCANAARHTLAGTPVTIGAAAAQDGTARLWVHDDGPGIPEAEQARLFERFHRGRTSGRPSDSGGAGLGLAIVAAIAAAHGGRVELDSGPGRGSTFTVVLPGARAR